jgi:putative ABC transport system permease protein
MGFIGGMYPALVLSGFNPIKTLKGNYKTGTSGVWLRKSLIVVQFVISVGLIVSTLIIHGQLTFIQNKKLGYNKDHIVMLPTDNFIRDKMHAMKSELLSNRNITSITTVNQSPVFIPGKYNMGLKGRNMIVTAVRTDKDFVKTMQLQLTNGTDFSLADQQLSDSEEIQQPLIINEAAVKLLGWTSEQAIGQPISFQGRNCFIKGVVKDFHFSSMHDAISPFVIFLSTYARNIAVKLTGNDLPGTLNFIKHKWSVFAPHRPFEYEFLDEQFDKLYSSETRTGKLFYIFAVLAIALACLGLLGLSTFTAQQRTKEIGIRKVLGASVPRIVALLSREFVKLVAIASLIAFPLAGYAMHQWLQDFNYRITISTWVFILAGAAALIIALVTIGIQVIKAALANPVKSLRTE